MTFFPGRKSRCRLADGFNFFMGALVFFMLAAPASAYDVVVAWDPNSEPDLAGYVLYVDDGTTQMPYEYVDEYPLQNIDAENPRAKITDLQEDVAYYFVVTAYDAAGNESDYSNEICVMNGKQCPDNYLASRKNTSTNSSAGDGGGGGGGGGCFIAAMSCDASNDGGPIRPHILGLFMLLAATGLIYIFAFIKSATTRAKSCPQSFRKKP